MTGGRAGPAPRPAKAKNRSTTADGAISTPSNDTPSPRWGPMAASLTWQAKAAPPAPARANSLPRMRQSSSHKGIEPRLSTPDSPNTGSISPWRDVNWIGRVLRPNRLARKRKRRHGFKNILCAGKASYSPFYPMPNQRQTPRRSPPIPAADEIARHTNVPVHRQ